MTTFRSSAVGALQEMVEEAEAQIAHLAAGIERFPAPFQNGARVTIHVMTQYRDQLAAALNYTQQLEQERDAAVKEVEAMLA